MTQQDILQKTVEYINITAQSQAQSRSPRRLLENSCAGDGAGSNFAL